MMSSRRNRALLVAAAGVAVIAVALAISSGGDDSGKRAEPGPSQTAEQPPATTPEPSDPVAGAYFGVHTKVDGANAETKQATIALEEELGRTVDINHHFYPWNEPFPTDLERWDLDHGRIPLVSWNGRDAYASDIAEGRHDRLIVDRAVRVKELGQPIMIRWFWEMDGNKKAEWAESPQAYIAAWRHIREIFEREGATNVAWVWCPNASAFEDGEAQAFYPGSEYVDWICADGYNWAPGRRGDEWESFDDIFGAFYAWASSQGKPIMVGEYGVQERDEGEKAGWIRHVQTTVKTRYPLIRALIYFNANQDFDWRVDTTPESSDAFRDMANDPWFNSDLEGTMAAG